ncbi:hypothetical protein [Leuconostoc lactis]|uniref:hypothetical protein n=1 Tax=Leuconostoc lactis TaxID=1246 RepID=UPI0016797C8B|nr:hypothetical protein [Leuconostoc lactis]GHC27584.1 hypothetical protein GCM10008913_14390 [Leuconostoc lactis KCTC 3528 = DSM 20202]
MTQSHIKKTLIGLLSLIAFYVYQSLSFRQTILSGTPGNNRSDHILNLVVYMVIMLLEFFILILGYDTIVNIFSPEFMKDYYQRVAISSLITTAVSAVIGAQIFNNNFVNVVTEYFKTNKYNHTNNFYLLNEKLSSTSNVFWLTLMCALFAVSLVIFVLALAEAISESIKKADCKK